MKAQKIKTKKYIVYNGQGKIIRLIECPETMAEIQTGDGEFVMEGNANDVTQKVEFDGLDNEGQPINARIVNKTPEEIEADNPAPLPIPFEKQPAHITNEQWQSVLDRLNAIEGNK